MKNPPRYLRLVALHALGGAAFKFSKELATIWAVSIIIFGVVQILKTNNRKGHAHLFAAYMVGAEIVIRMSKPYVFYEVGKYGVILFLLLGIGVERKKIGNSGFLLYIALLLPSILLLDASKILTPWRQVVSSQLSGPITLAISGVYFYKRKFNAEDFRNLVSTCILPIISAVFLIVVHLRSLDDLVFGTTSNQDLSGGFGPNQVSTALGMGMLFMLMGRYLRRPISMSKKQDTALAVIFFSFGTLTFSRGGIFSGMIAYMSGTIAGGLASKEVGGIRRILRPFGALVVFFAVWFMLDSQTNGMLEKRWTGEFRDGNEVTFTNRTTIALMDLRMFKENPLTGVGLGMSQLGHYVLARDFDVNLRSLAAPHTEYSRLLAEHGFLGLLALSVLCFLAYERVKMRDNPNSKPIAVSLIVLAGLTMAHSAMRLAAPGFLFGLAFVKLVDKKGSAEPTHIR